MRFGWSAVLLLAVAFLAVQGVEAGCYTPGVSKPRVEPGKPAHLPALKFKGGERACVIAMGDHDPVQRITLEVYDRQALKAKNPRPVARADSGSTDLVSVIWYPPRDEEYVVVISIGGNVYNDCYISVK